MTTPKIITTHVFPPIPSRNFDWSAHIDGQEEEGPCGWGKTEEEARRSLMDEMAEIEDEKNYFKTQSTLGSYED